MLKAPEVVAGKEFLSQVGQWPRIPAQTNPKKWLDGFQPGDRPMAAALLDSFIFINDDHMSKLFTSVFHGLSSTLLPKTHGDYRDHKTSWNHFLTNCVITFPTGESPSPTDSGYAFARRARQRLQVKEGQVQEPQHALAAAAQGRTRCVVFVDDFAGSGNQFLCTWRRSYTMTNGKLGSFSRLPRIDARFIYLPLVATEYAIQRIKDEAPSVEVRTAHVLGPEYSAIHPESIIFPADLRSGAREFIVRASSHAGLTNSPLGFHDLALAIAFENSIPDATLPLFWEETSKWTPLMKRT